MTSTASPGPHDAELAARAQAGDGAALDELIFRYRRFARARARAYFVAGGDRDDLEQEALIALVHAAQDHRPEHGPFRPFADLCISRALVSAIRRANRQKHRVLTEAVSINAGPEREEPAALQPVAAGPGPEDLVVGAASARSVGAEVARLLSPLERQVLALVLDDRTYQEVAEELGRS